MADNAGKVKAGARRARFTFLEKRARNEEKAMTKICAGCGRSSYAVCLTIRADAPWKTAEAFLEDARVHPGKLKMGNAGTGSIWHLATAMLEQKSGVRFTHIPYEGAGSAVSALMSGFVDEPSVRQR